MEVHRFFALLALLIPLMVILSACETGYGLTEVHAEIDPTTKTIQRIDYKNGKEYGDLTFDYQRNGDNVTLKIDAGNVAAFEGQAIAAERDRAIVEAVVDGIEELMPGLLCASGLPAACVP